jgi:hypothetical protein
MYFMEKEWNEGGLMNETAKFTTTRTDGWQKICRQWAEAGEAFELHGVGAGQLAFCKELCEEHGYECRYESHNSLSAAVFVPMP